MKQILLGMCVALYLVVVNPPLAQADCTPQGSHPCSSPTTQSFLATAHSIGIQGGSVTTIGSVQTPDGRVIPMIAQKYVDLSQADSNIIQGGAMLCGWGDRVPIDWDRFYALMGGSPSAQQLQTLIDAAKSTICVYGGR